MENIKREMFENTKKQDKVERNLTSIKAGEEATEEEIRILEKRQSEAKDEAELRKITEKRIELENKRRSLEKERWDAEDELENLNFNRKMIKEKYQDVASKAKQIRAQIFEIEDKINKP